jgi:hypothetical protein
MHHTLLPLLGFVLIGSALGAIFGLLTFIFWVWMLIDAIKNPRLDGTQRVIWVLVIFFLPCLGSIIYYFAGRGK